MANEQTEKKMDIELENPADFTSPEEYRGCGVQCADVSGHQSVEIGQMA